MLKRILSVIGASAMVASVALAQSGTTVSGRVINDAGGPLAGASVFIPSLNVGSQTNDQGRYSFVVAGARANGQTVALTARVIGFTSKSVQITLTNGTAISQNFQLVANPLRLGEVVVTGAGTSTTRERLTSTINSIDSASLHRVAQPQNVVSALAAQAPNVEVRTQSGEPGASASIKIRGASSLSGTNQPLFVVDGQPIDNSTQSTMGGDQSTVATNRASDINPADIESIDILKGGAAAAIYGARASNGVVLITTKRGHAGPTRYSFTSTETTDNVYSPQLVQTNYGQGFSQIAATCTTLDCTPNRYSWGPQVAAGTPVYNHQTELFDTGLTADNNLQISGGNDRTTFFASGGLTNQDGYFKGPNNKYNRATVRLKGTQQVSSQLSIGGNISYIDTRGRYTQKGSNVSGVMLGALRTPPTYDNENTYTDGGLQRPARFPNPSSLSAEENAIYYDNPFFILDNSGNTSELGRSIGNVNGDWTPLGWLTVKETLGSDYYNDSRLETLPLTSANNTLGEIDRLDINELTIDNNLIATAQHTFSEKLDATLTVGQNLDSRRNRQFASDGQELVAPTPYALQNTISQTASESKSLIHDEGYFTQAELDFFQQLVINVGVRNDGFSTFGASNRRANYPKASAAWTFTKWLGSEPNSGWLNYGKLHFAFGETGKEPPVYGAVTALSTGGFALGGFGDGLKAGINGEGALSTSGTIGNPALRPERDRETEFGGDFAFYRSKIELTATYYDKRSSDVILSSPVNAAQFGATQEILNAASLTNQGVELTLNLHPLQTKDATWDIGVNFGRNKGDVTNLNGAQFIEYGNQGFTGAIGSSTLGYAPGVIRGDDFARCGRGLTLPVPQMSGTQNIDALCGSAAKGALFLGPNGQPIVDPTERVIADPNPKYSMSYNTSLRLWNKITLSGLLDVRKGGSVWDGTRGILDNFGTGIDTEDRTTQGTFGQNFLTDVFPVVAGPGAGVPAFTTQKAWQNWYQGNGGGFGPVGSQFIEDGSFVKLRDIGITYTLDQRWVRALSGFSTADVRIAGKNLKTWTKYKGFDPEANLGGAEFLTQGLDYFSNPMTRSFVVSISLNR